MRQQKNSTESTTSTDMIGDETIADGSGNIAGIPYRKRTSGTWHGPDDVV